MSKASGYFFSSGKPLARLCYIIKKSTRNLSEPLINPQYWQSIGGNILPSSDPPGPFAPYIEYTLHKIFHNSHMYLIYRLNYELVVVNVTFKK